MAPTNLAEGDQGGTSPCGPTKTCTQRWDFEDLSHPRPKVTADFAIATANRFRKHIPFDVIRTIRQCQ